MRLQIKQNKKMKLSQNLKVFVMTANEDMERFKLVIAGDGACGKTSLLTVFKVGYI